MYRLRYSEASCLSVAQYNERCDIVSGICLCNYPNVPSVPPYDWFTWLKTIYGKRILTATERNTMFVHLLVWDERYSNKFLAELLAAVFDMTTYCQYVILVVPPRVTPGDFSSSSRFSSIHHIRVHSLGNLSVFEREMSKVLAKTATRDVERDALQFLYLADRYRFCPKLKIRRVVEEDHDDVIAIVDGETGERYGRYCISEMIRQPNSCRRSIIGEDPADGSAVGVVCLNSTIDVDLLNENFELTPYNGLKKLLSPPCSNVFVLEMFATRDGTRPHCSHDLLEAAFDCFPHLEYCAVLLPFSHPSYQFLQHFVVFFMQRVPLRCNRDFPMTLYLVHRAALREEMRCRRARVQDREAIEELLLTVSARHEVLADFHRSHLDCFVFESNDTMLGLAILCAESEVNLVTNHYHIEDYVSVRSIPQDGYRRLLHFVLMPIFSAYHRFFFREIARLSELTVLFYRLVDESTVMLPLVSCLNDMIPVDPRGQAQYGFPIILENLANCENNAKRDDGRFSLFITSPRLATMPRVIIDARIVVVGASDCGIAFVEYLAVRSMQRYEQLTNLTLISPHGIPFDKESSRAEACLLPFRGRFHSEYRRCITARAWVNVVYGTMTAINRSSFVHHDHLIHPFDPTYTRSFHFHPRKKKHVTLMNQGNFTYDYLALTCGLQYQNSTLRDKIKQEENKEQIPWNCLTINDDTEASACFRKIRWLTGDFKERKTILFYGHNIDCYCALGAFIKLGVKPSWITLIEPDFKPCFHDSEVDKAVTNAILQSGIKVFSAWSIIDWALIEKDDTKLMIESVTIEREGETKKLSCNALFNFYEKTIDLNAFLAFCRAGLVFDGSLIIDPECRTNDPFIFAAGTLTRYSRKFYADAWQHKYYDSVEIGERLAVILRRAIERVPEQMPKKQEIIYFTPSIFRAPTVIACLLPGGYHYLHVRGPGTANTSSGYYGQAFVTGSCESEIGYFRIRLNKYDTVENVICLSKKTFRLQNVIALYGKHESMLNELKLRFRNSCISDFYAYFGEPWAAAILHNRFDCLRVENRATLLSRMVRDLRYDIVTLGIVFRLFSFPIQDLIDDCVRMLIGSEWKTMSEEDRRCIESRYAGSAYHRQLEKNLVNCLEFYEHDLPMYCTLRRQRQMYMNIEESPLYFDQ
ncbi:PREDICTED: cilia- and flagella-associated protein 61-like [Vollenhovia emeryi]|uniref:cilia- and flagella-associated protein 61-like n=1 Tax=Vollenhovia emeryi TaxID=411798 RepID=UPI0005F4630F|nr:PREDICTED: cilia- and flagella-associated protein 61-like [Vollenhovia emeryi]